jgi:hypothetical protein
MFARSEVANPLPPAEESKPPAPKGTQMFALPTAAGSAAESAPSIPKLQAKTTQPFGLPPIESKPSGTHKQTQMFALPKTPTQQPVQPPVQPSTPIAATESKRTQMFALPKVPPVSQTPAEPAPPKHTQMFASVGTAPGPTAPGPTAVPTQGGAKRTQMFTPPTDPRQRAPQAPVASPRVGAIPGAKVELPAEERAPRSSREPLFVLESRSTSPLVIAGVLAAVLVVLGGGYFAYRSLSGRSDVIPPDAELTRSAALSKLRKDDSQSRHQANAELSGLVSTYPSYVAARADQVLGLSLELDDTRISVQRLTDTADSVSHRISVLRDRKSPSDWQNRVNAMTDELEGLRAKREPLGKQLAELDVELTRAVRDLILKTEGTQDKDESVLRALAVYNGVKGVEQTMSLAHRYERAGATDGWGAIAVAEYAVNARVPEKLIHDANQRIANARAKDSTFIRASVMGARLLIAQRKYPEATALLESVRTLNPKHELAQQLMAWIEVAKHEGEGE